MRIRLRLERYPVWGIQLMSGGRENGVGKELVCSYPEPAQVPQGE